jgi:hypothetical protein
VPWLIRSVVPALVLIGLGVLLLVLSFDFRSSAARFPAAVAILLIFFASIDLYCRTKLPGAVAMLDFWGADFSRRVLAAGARYLMVPCDDAPATAVRRLVQLA